MIVVHKGKIEDEKFSDSENMDALTKEYDDFRALLWLSKPSREGRRYVQNLGTTLMCVERRGMTARGTLKDFIEMDPDWADVIDEIAGNPIVSRCRICGAPLLDPDACYCDKHKEQGRRADNEKIMNADSRCVRELAAWIVEGWMTDYDARLANFKKAKTAEKKREYRAAVEYAEKRIRGQQFGSLTLGAADPEAVIYVHRKNIWGDWKEQRAMIKSKADAELFTSEQIEGICRHCRKYGRDKCRQCAIPIVTERKKEGECYEKSHR